MIFGLVDVAQKDAEIQQPLVQPLAYIHRVAADDMKEDARIAFLQLAGSSCNLTHSVGLSGADVNVAADGLVGLGDLLFRPPHQV